jgi:hypothetical protein
MNRSAHWFISLAALTCLMAVTGCKTVSTSSHQYLGTPTYPPTVPAQVEILRTPPTRPHVQLGEIRAQPSSSSVSNLQLEQALQKQAARMGANAVVVTVDHDEVTGASVVGPVWSRSVYTVTGRVITGVAIRFEKP